MSENIKVVVDAMGGDNAPEVTVEGAVEALKVSDKISIILTGRTEDIKKELIQCAMSISELDYKMQSIHNRLNNDSEIQ